MVIIGIAGGTGSGKTTFVKKLLEALPIDAVTVIPQDAYYTDNKDIPIVERQKKNYDHPDAIDWHLLIRHLEELKQGRTVDRPVYSMLTCSREKETVKIIPSKVVILEGILSLVNEELRHLYSLKIFIDAHADHRLMRVVKRDMQERGRNIEEVMLRYLDTVRPMHEVYIEPSKQFADVIIPVGADNHVAIQMLAQYIQTLL